MSTHGAEVEGSPELIEDDGWNLLVLIIRLAKAGAPYKDKLPALKMYAERCPEIKNALRSIVAANDWQMGDRP